MSPLGQRIDTLRCEKGWNWKELSRRSRLHTQSIYKIVHGERTDPRLSVIVRLALAFEVSIDTLLGPLNVYAQPLKTLATSTPPRRRRTTTRPDTV